MAQSININICDSIQSKQISGAEEFQIIYVNTLPSRRWSITPHSLGRACIVTSFQEEKL